MNRIHLLPLGLLALAACAETTTSPQPTGDWSQVGLVGAATAAPNAGIALAPGDGKPLTTLLFGEVPLQSVNGLTVEGVTFGFTVGGSPSVDARYNSGGPTPGPYIACPCLEGDALGTLTITFDKPTQVVQFGLALQVGGSLAVGATVDVIGPNGKSRGVFPIATSPAPLFTGGQFTYDKNAVSQLVITFNPAAPRFAIDNLKYHQAPR